MEKIKVQVDKQTFPTFEILQIFEINNEEYAICKRRDVRCENKKTRQNA